MEKVYILECNWYYKIWFTSQETVEKRVDSMKTWNPMPINIVKVYDCPDKDWREKEKKLHYFLADKNHSLEWFKLSKSDFIIIDKLMWLDIIEIQLKKQRDELKKEINKYSIMINKLKNEFEEVEKYTLKDSERNHIKLEWKKIILKKRIFNWNAVLSWETDFWSKWYFVNVYSNTDYYTLSFKRKIKKW
jgi:hypothetical protein